MSALLVPCTYTVRPTPAAWREGIILRAQFVPGSGLDFVLRIAVADVESGELHICSHKDVRVHTGAQVEEHH